VLSNDSFWRMNDGFFNRLPQNDAADHENGLKLSRDRFQSVEFAAGGEYARQKAIPLTGPPERPGNASEFSERRAALSPWFWPCYERQQWNLRSASYHTAFAELVIVVWPWPFVQRCCPPCHFCTRWL
jgi:hypothetical protein